MSIFVHPKRKKILEGLSEKNPNPYTKNRTVPLTVAASSTRPSQGVLV